MYMNMVFVFISLLFYIIHLYMWYLMPNIDFFDFVYQQDFSLLVGLFITMTVVFFYKYIYQKILNMIFEYEWWNEFIQLKSFVKLFSKAMDFE